MDRKNAAKSIYMLDWTKNGESEAFVRGTVSGNNGTDLNSRINKNEYFAGTPVVLDPNNASDEFEMYGVVGGHYTMRGGGFVALTPMKRVTDKDAIYLNVGIVLDWPGITPQF
jgi:hypothetical protein